jgi:hypothetical protein
VPLVAFVALTVICNLTILSAIAAGRLESGWNQRLLLAAEVALLVFALLAVGALAWVMGVVDDRLSIALLLLLALVVAMPLAGLLTYGEYLLAGRRQSFGMDLRRSMWLGRYGAVRLDPKSDPEMVASAERMSSALAHGDISEAANELNDLAGQLEGEFGANERLAAVIKELKSATEELGSQSDVTPEGEPRRN